jgi:hypothetical protein
MIKHGCKQTILAGLTLFAVLVISGCDHMHESPDFERHSNSQLSVPPEGGDYYWFDVKLSAEFPEANVNAEAKRMEWLQGWLDARNVCAHGYVIIERREFGFLEHNPAHYDLRYKVQCDVAPPTE